MKFDITILDVGRIAEIAERLPVTVDNAVLGESPSTDFYWVHWIVSEYLRTT